MRTALARIGALAVVLGFQFAIYPGHTYVKGPGQILAPQLEHLESPAFLTRDLVAVNPNLTFTVLDEASLFLRRSAHLELPAALAVQQVISRGAGLTGTMLIASAAGLTGWWPLLIATGAGFIGNLPSLEVSPFELEATPWSMAFGFVLLATGLFAQKKPLLAGLAGGLAILYDPRIAAPFWILLLLALSFDRRLRRSVRPTLPLLAVFALLLANFAQLQPSTSETRSLFGVIPSAVEAVQRWRTPGLWPTAWEGRDLLFYAAVCAVTTWATAYLWPSLSPALRWLLVGLPLAGFVSIPLSAIIGGFHLRAVPLLHPARSLLFAALPGSITCAVAGLLSKNTDRWLFLSLPSLLLIVSLVPPLAARSSGPQIEDAARWSRDNTWGASMFAFPDAGRGSAPGTFRALAIRPVWTDWETGSLCDSSDAFAIEWRTRWQDTMTGKNQPEQLRHLLTLPIDYIVLSPRHAIRAAKPVFGDPHWLIYDTSELRNLPKAQLALANPD